MSHEQNPAQYEDNHSTMISWTSEKDGILLDVVHRITTNNTVPLRWSQLAMDFPPASWVDCRDRWLELNRGPGVKLPWAEEEDCIIIFMHREYGTKWTEFAKALPGRAENSIKNRWNSTTRRVARYELSVKRQGISALKPEVETQVLFKYCRQVRAMADPTAMSLDPSGLTLLDLDFLLQSPNGPSVSTSASQKRKANKTNNKLVQDLIDQEPTAISNLLAVPPEYCTIDPSIITNAAIKSIAVTNGALFTLEQPLRQPPPAHSKPSAIQNKTTTAASATAGALNSATTQIAVPPVLIPPNSHNRAGQGPPIYAAAARTSLALSRAVSTATNSFHPLPAATTIAQNPHPIAATASGGLGAAGPSPAVSRPNVSFPLPQNGTHNATTNAAPASGLSTLNHFSSTLGQPGLLLSRGMSDLPQASSGVTQYNTTTSNSSILHTARHHAAAAAVAAATAAAAATPAGPGNPTPVNSHIPQPPQNGTSGSHAVNVPHNTFPSSSMSIASFASAGTTNPPARFTNDHQHQTSITATSAFPSAFASATPMSTTPIGRNRPTTIAHFSNLPNTVVGTGPTQTLPTAAVTPPNPPFLPSSTATKRQKSNFNPSILTTSAHPTSKVPLLSSGLSSSGLSAGPGVAPFTSSALSAAGSAVEVPTITAALYTSSNLNSSNSGATQRIIPQPPQHHQHPLQHHQQQGATTTIPATLLSRVASPTSLSRVNSLAAVPSHVNPLATLHSVPGPTSSLPHMVGHHPFRGASLTPAETTMDNDSSSAAGSTAIARGPYPQLVNSMSHLFSQSNAASRHHNEHDAQAQPFFFAMNPTLALSRTTSTVSTTPQGIPNPTVGHAYSSLKFSNANTPAISTANLGGVATGLPIVTTVVAPPVMPFVSGFSPQNPNTSAAAAAQTNSLFSSTFFRTPSGALAPEIKPSTHQPVHLHAKINDIDCSSSLQSQTDTSTSHCDHPSTGTPAVPRLPTNPVSMFPPGRRPQLPTVETQGLNHLTIPTTTKLMSSASGFLTATSPSASKTVQATPTKLSGAVRSDAIVTNRGKSTSSQDSSNNQTSETSTLAQYATIPHDISDDDDPISAQ